MHGGRCHLHFGLTLCRWFWWPLLVPLGLRGYWLLMRRYVATHLQPWLANG